MTPAKFCLLFACTLTYISIYAQIGVRQTAAVEEVKTGYDSLSNIILGPTVKNYIGQEIYIVPFTKQSPTQVYTGFTTDLGEAPADGFKDIAGTTFKIVEIKEVPSGEYHSRAAGIYFKLANAKYPALYYKLGAYIRPRLSEYHPFIFSGYFEKLKQLNVGQEFITPYTVTDAINLNTGKGIECKEGSEWKCVDLTYIELASSNRATLVYVFKNAAGEEIAVAPVEKGRGVSFNLDEFRRKSEVVAKQQQEEAEEKARLAQEKKDKAQQAAQAAKNAAASAEAKKLRRENLIKKYGERQGTIIADGKVEIGMTPA
ncbi:MAG TPA: hypothetical protein VK154_00245, partial [Chitinophagales bacterium]|nr:hypothetical protein [Chitinophagales bacterium]